MLIRNRLVLLGFGLAIGLLPVGVSRADLVLLRNGRTLPVAGHHLDGDRIVLLIEGGGVISLRQDLVAEVRPDSAPPVPAPSPSAVEAVPGQEAAVDDPIRLLPGEVFDPGSLRTLAGRLARRHGVSEALVQAVIQVESRYDAFAVSPRGAMGLMQLMPKTAARFAVGNAFDPIQNVDGGVRYLRELLERYDGEVRLALAAYNAGEEAVDRFRGIPPYRETRQYVAKILRILSR